MQQLDLVGVNDFASICGISRQSVLQSKERAKKDTYRGKFPKPDVTIGELDYWFRETAMKYAKSRSKGQARQDYL